ncbi:MAG TPA: hypothetical protein VNN73_13490 [Blastocatellia bacterium]|nr:hypothetical protein [Blastocatellia bacterium]
MAFDKVDTLIMVITALERLGIQYLIGGSFASSFYGYPRTTMDADVLASIKLDQADALVKEIQSEFYVDAQAVRRAIQTNTHFNLIHTGSLFKVDVFLAKSDAFTANQLERRQLHSLRPDQSAYFATAEDTILAKLNWYRRGGEISDLQWRDIIGIINVQGSRLDLGYLRQWAQQLNVHDLLEEALIEAETK